MFIQAVGFATPMGTGVITSTLAGNGIRIGSTTTATATDKPGNPSIALGPAAGGAQLSDPARTGPKIAAKPARRRRGDGPRISQRRNSQSGHTDAALDRLPVLINVRST
jgi:hypothetical protein